MLFAEIAVVAVLIVVNGFLAMSEIALVSSRPARLKVMAERGVAGARRALRLAADPARFLSTVQIGITMVGILSGAFSGATLGVRLSEWLAGFGLSVAVAELLGIGSVVVLITYCALIVGELVPKQMALRNPEAIAARVAPAMLLLSRFAAPLVWVLSVSGRAVLRATGQDGGSRRDITDEEIEALLAEAENLGQIEPDERRMMAGVLQLGDRTVGQIMCPREEVDWIDLAADAETIREALIATEHSHLPAARGDPAKMVGIVRNRELLSALLRDQPLRPHMLLRDAPVVKEHAGALDVLAALREAGVPLALVEDEEGGFRGVVSPVDILDAVAGVIRLGPDGDPDAVRRPDGSWLLSGSLPVADMAATLGMELPPAVGQATVAGFVQARFGRLPGVGETVDAFGWRFEVVDRDGRRIDKVLAAPLDGGAS